MKIDRMKRTKMLTYFQLTRVDFLCGFLQASSFQIIATTFFFLFSIQSAFLRSHLAPRTQLATSQQQRRLFHRARDDLVMIIHN